MIKRFGLMVLALLALGLAGCGKVAGPEPGPASSTKVGTTPAAPQSLTIWWAQWAPSEGLQQMGEQFAKETGIQVKVHQIPWPDYQTQVFLNFGNEKTDFDIVIGDSQWIGRGATKGLYLELTDWLPKAVDLKQISAPVLSHLCEYPIGSGKYFAAPCESDAVGIAYRKDWFEDQGERARFLAKYGYDLAVPKTWEQFRQIAEFFHRPSEKRYGAGILTGRGYDALTMGYQHFLWGFGGSWGDPATHKVQGFANHPGAVKGLEFMRDLVKFGPPNGGNLEYNDSLDAFTNGSCAMSMNYFAFFPDIAKTMGGKAGFFRIPSMTAETPPVISLGGQGMSISKKVSPAQQELAKQFIAWFLTEQNQRLWVTKPAGFTAHSAILASPDFHQASPYNAPFADSLAYLRDFWNNPKYNELLAVVQRQVGAALDGADAKTALDALAQEHEVILREAGLLK